MSMVRLGMIYASSWRDLCSLLGQVAHFILKNYKTLLIDRLIVAFPVRKYYVTRLIFQLINLLYYISLLINLGSMSQVSVGSLLVWFQLCIQIVCIENVTWLGYIDCE